MSTARLVAPLKNATVTLVELDQREFTRLEEMGKVSKPSEDDLKIGQLVVSSEASDADETDVQAPAKQTASKPEAGKGAAGKPGAGKPAADPAADPNLDV